MPNPNSVGRWIKGLLCVVGGAAILVHGGLWIIRSTATSEKLGTEIAQFPSPNGHFKAVLFTAIGGGAISPFCIDSIFVAAKDTRVKFNDDALRVYLAGCHSFRDRSTNNRTNGPELKWLANDHLQIRFSANEGLDRVRELAIRGFALGGDIRISYVVTEDER
jgi:hypothetical protein